MDRIPNEPIPAPAEVFGHTLNDRAEPVYKNTAAFLTLDGQESHLVRRLRVAQVNNLKLGIHYERFFDSIRSEFPKPDGLAYSHYDGILVAKIPEPKLADDYDAFVSPASHFEILTVARGKKPDQWPDPTVPLFTLIYAKDRLTHKRLLITDFRRSANNPGYEQDAILRIFNPSYFFFMHEDEMVFDLPKI